MGIGLTIKPKENGFGVDFNSQMDILSLNAWQNGCKIGVWVCLFSCLYNNQYPIRILNKCNRTFSFGGAPFGCAQRIQFDEMIPCWVHSDHRTLHFINSDCIILYSDKSDWILLINIDID